MLGESPCQVAVVNAASREPRGVDARRGTAWARLRAATNKLYRKAAPPETPELSWRACRLALADEEGRLTLVVKDEQGQRVLAVDLFDAQGVPCAHVARGVAAGHFEVVLPGGLLALLKLPREAALARDWLGAAARGERPRAAPAPAGPRPPPAGAAGGAGAPAAARAAAGATRPTAPPTASAPGASKLAEAASALDREAAAIMSCRDARVLLELPSGASSAAVKRAYAPLALRWHPDKCAHPRAADCFAKVHAAFVELRAQAAEEERKRASVQALHNASRPLRSVSTSPAEAVPVSPPGRAYSASAVFVSAAAAAPVAPAAARAAPAKSTTTAPSAPGGAAATAASTAPVSPEPQGPQVAAWARDAEAWFQGTAPFPPRPEGAAWENWPPPLGQAARQAAQEAPLRPSGAHPYSDQVHQGQEPQQQQQQQQQQSQQQQKQQRPHQQPYPGSDDEYDWVAPPPDLGDWVAGHQSDEAFRDATAGRRASVPYGSPHSSVVQAAPEEILGGSKVDIFLSPEQGWVEVEVESIGRFLERVVVRDAAGRRYDVALDAGTLLRSCATKGPISVGGVSYGVD
jgi:hypothetical protein